MSHWAMEAYLRSCGWELSGRVTTRTLGSGTEMITWWQLGKWEYPQHFALSLERLGWRKILETMP